MEDKRGTSMWAVGWMTFAAFVMVTIGFFQVLQGLAAIFKNDFFVVGSEYLYKVDVSTWGWIHLILGVIVFFAGFGLFSGAVWARTVGVIMAVLAAIANFAWLPYQPAWSIMIIALCVAVIWALTVHGRDVADS
jgi:hypothetical protein